MKSKVRLKFLILPVLLSCCKGWDPNKQYLSEISSLKSDQTNLMITETEVNIDDIKIGDSLSQVITMIGNNYKIAASLRQNNANWLKIETEETSNSTIVEFFFKNHKLVSIYKH